MLTCDHDFGTLAFADKRVSRCGVILLRLPTPTLDAFVEMALAALDEQRDWADHFSVIEPGRIRMKALPSDPPSAHPTHEPDA